ncbi:MAG TPA: OmpW family protein [Chromatiales bacterium]|nr:OmpW family protein [Chromatiales bacterium]
MRIRHLTRAAGAALLLAVSAAAHAAGPWFVRFGITHIAPNDDSDRPPLLAAGSKVSVEGDTGLSVAIGRFLTEHVAVEVLGALPFEHDIKGAGSIASLGTVATAKQLPPTVTLQYHFSPQAAFSPYVGLGLNYTFFFDIETKGALAGTSLDLDSSWGAALQLGADFRLAGDWLGNVDVRWIDIDTEASGSATGTFDVQIDPWVVTVGVGRRF